MKPHRRVHFVGIGGIGMSGIAELLVNLGYEVSGSDAKRSEITDRLAGLGVRVHEGHDAENVRDADVVVISSAVGASNPEVVAARERSIPVIPRAEMLAELMRLLRGIAVAGAHGKTTTTSRIALVLERAGLDPTAVIGGRLSAFGSNAKLGRGAWMVAEADESDRSFLRLSPTVAVITNLDREHMDSYGSFEQVQRAFVEFANKVPFDGYVVACADDRALAAVLPEMTRRVITYGIEADADLRASDIDLQPFASVSRVWRRVGDERTALGELRLSVPGRHNVANALAAVAVALELESPFETIRSALHEFHGAERRFQRLGDCGGVTVVDDYGHHPTEIAAVIAAARSVKPARLVIAFQPHRYTRTRDLLPEFGTALSGADEIVLTDIYSAGEAPIPGATLDAIVASVRAATRAPVHVVPKVDDVPSAVAALVHSGDLVITLGAGSIGTVGRRILAELERKRGVRR